MRANFGAICLIVICSAAARSADVQVAPVPPDPLELVTGPTQVPATPEQRAAVVSLLNRAMENHNLHLRSGAPYVLNMSLSLAASTVYPASAGSLQESWISGENWRWSTNLPSYPQTALSFNGAVYDENAAPMPMGLREIRQAVFAPVPMTPGRPTLRTAAEMWNGAQVTCVMLSNGANPQTPAQGRQWYETEYCIDPATAALQIFSEAPGVYVVYDYSNGLKFHKRLLPGKISVSENGAVVAEANLTSITDADPANVGAYTPSAEMTSRGAGAVLGRLERFGMFVYSDKVPSAATVQPVIVHVTLDAQGGLREYRALQSGAATDQAVALIRNRQYSPVPSRPEPPPFCAKPTSTCSSGPPMRRPPGRPRWYTKGSPRFFLFTP